MHFFNNGDGCGPNGVSCDVVDVCPNDDDVTSYVMSANMGGHCSDGGNINMDSVVLKLERAGSSITLMGVIVKYTYTDFRCQTCDAVNEVICSQHVATATTSVIAFDGIFRPAYV